MNKQLHIIFFFLIVAELSCKKDSALLNLNPDSSLTNITTLDDAQALLDNISVMQETPSLGELSSDDFFLLDTVGLSQNPMEINAYFWQSDIYQGRRQIDDWNLPYKQVFFANTVLDALTHISDSSDISKRNFIKGSALFVRAYAYFNVALLFASLPNAVPSTLGIPLRLNADPNIRSTRASVADTYDQILHDLIDASRLLPVSLDHKRKNRPSRPATFGLLARVYLSMGDYVKAGEYADSCLKYYSVLIDYNSLLGTVSNPFSVNQPEVIYQSNLLSTTTIFKSKNWYIDTSFYRSYHLDDLRKDVFFRQDAITRYPVQQYSYSGNQSLFSGIATDEIYLIRAEAYAKNGNPQAALKDLDTLLQKRWKTGSLPMLSATTANEALELVRAERRRELVFRGLRWIDIRRYNRESPGAPLTRFTTDKVFKLPPNDPRFVLLIPPDVIELSGIKQNPR